MSRNKSKERIVSKKNRNNGRLPFFILAGIGGALLVVAGIAFLPRNEVSPGFSPEVSGAPSLKVDKEQIDFGDVRVNQFVTAEFKLTNVGDKTLRFIEQPYVELKAGC
jgi:hypothetical protein